MLCNFIACSIRNKYLVLNEETENIISDISFHIYVWYLRNPVLKRIKYAQLYMTRILQVTFEFQDYKKALNLLPRRGTPPGCVVS